MQDLFATIKDTDIAYTWIKVLFANEPGKPLSAAFAVFTAALSFLGSLLMGWHVLVGIVSSAYSGKVLGDRWHQIWAPLRVVMGFGLLIPVGGGFSSVHFLLQHVIGVAAVNLGNAPIFAYIDAATDRKNVNSLQTTYGGTLVNEFLSREICFAVADAMNKKTIGRFVPNKPGVYQPPKEGVNPSWFNSKANKWDYGDCGSVTFFRVETGDSELYKDSATAITAFNDKRQKATEEMVQALRDAKFFNYVEIGKMLAMNGGWSSDSTTQSDIVQSLINRTWLGASIMTDLKQISDDWNSKVSTAAQAVFQNAAEQNGARLRARIEDYGFMVAGSYERSLSAISGMAVSLSSSQAILEKSKLTEKYSTQVAKALDLISGLRKEYGTAALAAGLAEPTDGEGFVPWVIGKVFPSNLSNGYLGRKSDDPIGDMMTFGHSLLNTASLGVIALVGGAFISGGPSAISQAGMNAFNLIASWISWMLVTFIVLGFLYAFLLPMLPMIMVFIMGISWLILYLEAAIAGVMWAFAFIRMDGQEFFDKNQAPGITLLFNLLLRPALGMLAYCGLLLLQPVLLNSLAEVWSGSFAAQTGPIATPSLDPSKFGLVWIWQFIAGLVLYSYLQWHLTIRLTGLIPTIPDRVGHWMGMQMHGYNDGHEISGAATALGGAGMALGRAPFAQMAGDIANEKNRVAKARADMARGRSEEIIPGVTPGQTSNNSAGSEGDSTPTDEQNGGTTGTWGPQQPGGGSMPRSDQRNLDE